MEPVKGLHPLHAPLLIGTQRQPLGQRNGFDLLGLGQGAHGFADAVLHLHGQGQALQQALQVAGAVGMKLDRVLAAGHEVNALHGGRLVEAVRQGLPVLHGGQVNEGAILQTEIAPPPGDGLQDAINLLGRFAVLLKLELEGRGVHAHSAAENGFPGGEAPELVGQVYLADGLKLRHPFADEIEDRVLPGEVHMALADREARCAQRIQHLALGGRVPQEQLLRAGDAFGQGLLIEGVNLPFAVAEGHASHHVPGVLGAVKIDAGSQGQANQLALQLLGDLHHGGQSQEGHQLADHPRGFPQGIIELALTAPGQLFAV